VAYASNTSSAYDLTAFEERAVPKKNTKGNLKIVKTSRRQHFLATLVTPKSFCLFMMVVLSVCYMVYNYAMLTELNNSISRYETELKNLNSNHVKMQSQAGSSMSARTIAQYAENELGLKLMDKYQTEYIYLYQEDRIELAQEPPGEARVNQSVRSAIDSFKEYLSIR